MVKVYSSPEVVRYSVVAHSHQCGVLFKISQENQPPVMLAEEWVIESRRKKTKKRKPAIR
jgi:hypothetical protein